jgi:hypothetical protein
VIGILNILFVFLLTHMLPLVIVVTFVVANIVAPPPHGFKYIIIFFYSFFNFAKEVDLVILHKRNEPNLCRV